MISRTTAFAFGLALGVEAAGVGGLIGVYKRATTGRWPEDSYMGMAVAKEECSADGGMRLRVNGECVLISAGFAPERPVKK